MPLVVVGDALVVTRCPVGLRGGMRDRRMMGGVRDGVVVVMAMCMAVAMSMGVLPAGPTLEGQEEQAPGVERGEERRDDRRQEGQHVARSGRHVGRLDDRVRRERRGHEDQRDVRLELLHCLLHRVADRHVLNDLTATAGGDAGNDLRAVVQAVLRLALARAADLIHAQTALPALQPGEIISTGTLTDALPVAAGDTWSTHFNGIDIQDLRIRFLP